MREIKKAFEIAAKAKKASPSQHGGHCPFCDVGLNPGTSKAGPCFTCPDCGWELRRPDVYDPQAGEVPDLRPPGDEGLSVNDVVPVADIAGIDAIDLIQIVPLGLGYPIRVHATIIRSENKPVAVLVHDPVNSSVVYKGDHSSQLYVAAMSLLGRKLVQIGRHNKIGIRRLVGPDHEDYLAVVISRLTGGNLSFSPIFTVEGQIDQASETLAQRHLTT
jgi:hypothetical protein